MRNLYLTSSELFEALREYGNIEKADSDEMLSQTRSSFTHLKVEIQSKYERLDAINEKMKNPMQMLVKARMPAPRPR